MRVSLRWVAVAVAGFAEPASHTVIAWLPRTHPFVKAPGTRICAHKLCVRFFLLQCTGGLRVQPFAYPVCASSRLCVCVCVCVYVCVYLHFCVGACLCLRLYIVVQVQAACGVGGHIPVHSPGHWAAAGALGPRVPVVHPHRPMGLVSAVCACACE
jgi:hypothetical protein